ncbi:MAG: site-specific DNA-methyltransferase, partial [Campylobacterales bacterium]|nr:site-specific DNA-methyltransferase [Campylobacterales bacterium]
LASDPATTLLKADEMHNSKPENAHSQNLLIKGDNLEVLKHLVNAYYEKVKMIYIDPPYNTGSDGFVYQDDRKFTVKELQNLMGVDAEKAKRILDFTQSKSNSHSAWLTFMYPRLYIAKQLLKDDGVIFVSIDDNEVANLRILCDEIFGDGNVETYIWYLNDSAEGSFIKTPSKTVRNEHEYIIACFKMTTYKSFEKYLDYRYRDKTDFTNPDNDPRGSWMSGNISRNGIKTTMGSKYFTITTPTGVKYSRNWTISKDEYKNLLEDNRLYFSNGGDGVPRLKIFQNEPQENTQSSLFQNLRSSSTGKKEVSELFNNVELFQFPKPTPLIQRLMTITNTKDSIVLDFFAGSGTTGDAVMQLNAKDGGNRKFILVQIPEKIDPKKNETAYEFVKNEL